MKKAMKDVQYPKKFQELYNDLPFLLEIINIKKIEKLATNFHDKAE